MSAFLRLFLGRIRFRRGRQISGLKATATLTLLAVLARGAHFLLYLGIGNRFGVTGATDAVFFLYAPLVAVANIAAAVSDAVVMPALHRGERMGCAAPLRAVFVRWALITVPGACVLLVVMFWLSTSHVGVSTVLLLMLVPLISAISSIYMGVLNAAARYRVAVLGPLCGALLGFLGLFLLPRTTVGLAGVLLLFEVGRFGWLRLQAPKSPERPPADVKMLRELIKWAARNGRMQAAGSLLMALNPLVDIVFARSLAAGSVTSVEYANRLWNVVPLVFSGYLTLIYARMSRQAAGGRMPWAFVSRRALVVSGLGLAVSGVAIALSVPVIHWVYGFGIMTNEARLTLARLLASYFVGAAPYVASLVYVRAFSARGRADVLFWIACVTVVANIVLDAVLIRWIGVLGIGLGTAGTYVLTLVLCFWASRKMSAHNALS